MKKLLLTIICGLFLSNASFAQIKKTFDFSNICESGQTLYYEIKTGNTVSLTGPEFKSGFGRGYWTSTKPTGHIVIPSKVTNDGVTYTVVTVGDRAFYCCDNIESVIIPNTVASIGLDAFNYCINLKSIVIPNSVKEIGNSAFETCSALQSITIPNSVISIGIDAFAKSGLRSLTIPSSIKDYGSGICKYCKDLVSVVLPSNLKEIGPSWFEGCSKLTTINIPNGVKKIQGAFIGCTSLSVKVPNTVTYIFDNYGSGFNEAFDNCLNVIYYGSLKGAPWGAECLNGYVEGGCVYKDKTKKTLVACKPSESKPTTVKNNSSSSGGNETRKTIVVDESNVRDRVKSMESSTHYDDLYYFVDFKSGMHGAIRYSSLRKHWQFCTSRAYENSFNLYQMAPHDSETGALVALYKAVHKYQKEYGYE